MAEMTPRERWLGILNRQAVDRVPVDYSGTPEVTARLLKDLGCGGVEELWRKLRIDKPQWFGARYLKQPECAARGTDMWGIRYTTIHYGTGAYGEATGHPLAEMERVEEIEAYAWPRAEDFDWSQAAERVVGLDDYRLRQAGTYEPFLLYCSLRGMEQAFEDLLLNPEIVESILRQIFDFYYEYNRRLFEAGRGKIDLTYVAEDLAGQTGPLFGLETYRKYLMPRQKQMADLAKSFGIHVFYHTDGAARVFLPDLVDVVGIEVLNPLQWRCPGMELAGLVRDFGGRIAFHGGIDNQQTLPFGSVEDVVREVEEVAAIMRGSRWICSPCHNIQPVTPTANIVAMYETIQRVGII